MEIEFIKANTSKTKPKATVHKTGKLGLNIEASNLMEIQNKKSFLIGRDKGDTTTLYLLESNAEGSVKVSKAGAYYYLNAGSVFDQMEFDYEKNNIMFDLSKDKYQNKDIYVLKGRPKTPRK
ncbi:hypothetical protein [Pedobacter sp. BMA]|uniref:hypothetical protein n=1 Tax=Pedobacter sp. BMA TaxID=1663685 RepID=UPI00064B27FB|nr:hypothetical protein [Pedobacter sp. BMA]KLT64015.1 hypothetical protein AB669_18280 [Pedobacter sp. BMA]